MYKLSTDTSLGSPVTILVRCPSVFQHHFIAERVLIVDLNGICALHPQSPHCTLHIDLLLSMQFINAVVQREGAATIAPSTTEDYDVRSIGRCSSKRVELVYFASIPFPPVLLLPLSPSSSRLTKFLKVEA